MSNIENKEIHSTISETPTPVKDKLVTAESLKLVSDIAKTNRTETANLKNTKLDKNQGAEHAGKALVVGEDGNVVLGKPQTEGVGDAADAIANTVSGTLLNIKDSAERKNKGFEMSGKTTQDGTPAPDAPVEIVNAGRLNEDTGKYEVDIVINSGNLFKVIEHTSGYYVDKDGKVQIAKTLGYSWTAAVNNLQKQTVTLHVTTAINTRYRLYCTDLQNTILYKYEDSSANTNDNSHTFNMPDGAKKIYVSVMEIDSAEQAEITLNLRNVTLPYEPYKEQTLTLTSDRPLTKWDRLVEQDGQIGWLYNSSETILNGTEDWIRHSEINKETTQAFGLSISDLVYGEDVAIGQNVFTDKFRYINAAWTKDEAGQAINNGCLFINIEKTKASTIEEFKAWLKSNNVKVVYKTKQTEFVPLPKEEQEAIRALSTYYPTTVVSNSEDAEMKLSYVADTKNYIDKKFEELNQTIVNTQIALL